ncbi:24151_t:CDS:1, partial [Entrophospora sp. SA101]
LQHLPMFLPTRHFLQDDFGILGITLTGQHFLNPQHSVLDGQHQSFPQHVKLSRQHPLGHLTVHDD